MLLGKAPKRHLLSKKGLTCNPHNARYCAEGVKYLKRHQTIVIFVEIEKMKEEGKTMEQLTYQLERCRQRITELQAMEAQRKWEVEI